MEMPGPVMRTLPLALALAGLSVSAAAPSHAAEVVVAYRSASCGCCKGWLDHLKKAGFTVQDNVVNNLTAIKQHYSLPTALDSCHTATINGYVIEGHVPVSAIQKLLKERPKLAGIALLAMLKLMDVPAFAASFLNDDLLSQRWWERWRFCWAGWGWCRWARRCSSITSPSTAPAWAATRSHPLAW